MTGTMRGFTNDRLNGAAWYWLLICTAFLILSIYLAFGPYGHIRLGRDDEEPEFSTPSWIAMLFAGGMGSGLLFRSEEHTSELQSLMRISYAVFCLKKKKK